MILYTNFTALSSGFPTIRKEIHRGRQMGLTRPFLFTMLKKSRLRHERGGFILKGGFSMSCMGTLYLSLSR